MTGFIGTVAFVFLLIQSPSVVRHSFYEVFLHGHIVAAAIAVGAVWVHLDGMKVQRVMYGVVALWSMERAWRLFRLIKGNVGNGGTQAEVEVLPGDALRVTVRMARPWAFRPGQHAYLYMPSVGLWTNHPFSVAWSEEEDDPNSNVDEKGLPMNRQDILQSRKTSMSYIIRRRTGFTEKLYRKADLSASGKFTTSAFVEGPYGECRPLLHYPGFQSIIDEVQPHSVSHANLTQAARISARMALSCSGLLVSASPTKSPRFEKSWPPTPTARLPLVGSPSSGSSNLRSISNGSAHG